MRDDDRMYTPAEVASRFRVDPKTVARWATQGKFPPGTVARTPGGHRRFDKETVERMIRERVDA